MVIPSSLALKKLDSWGMISLSLSQFLGTEYQ